MLNTYLALIAGCIHWKLGIVKWNFLIINMEGRSASRHLSFLPVLANWTKTIDENLVFFVHLKLEVRAYVANLLTGNFFQKTPFSTISRDGKYPDVSWVSRFALTERAEYLCRSNHFNITLERIKTEQTFFECFNSDYNLHSSSLYASITSLKSLPLEFRISRIAFLWQTVKEPSRRSKTENAPSNAIFNFLFCSNLQIIIKQYFLTTVAQFQRNNLSWLAPWLLQLSAISTIFQYFLIIVGRFKLLH